MIIITFWFVVSLIITLILGFLVGFKFRDGVVDMKSVSTPALQLYAKKLKQRKQFQKEKAIYKILEEREKGGSTWFDKYMMKDKAES